MKVLGVCIDFFKNEFFSSSFASPVVEMFIWRKSDKKYQVLTNFYEDLLSTALKWMPINAYTNGGNLKNPLKSLHAHLTHNII